MVQKGWVTDPEAVSEQLGSAWSTYRVAAGAGGLPMATESTTEPSAHVMSSSDVAGPHAATAPGPLAGASPRRGAGCVAGAAGRGAGPDQGASSGEPPPPAVMCTTFAMGR